jgi:5'-AMP-activated protein kinase regulatory gamma subunit
VTLEHTATVAEALDTLATHKILSAPVVLAASLEDQESDTFLGLVDGTHCCLFCLFVLFSFCIVLLASGPNERKQRCAVNTMLHTLVAAVQDKTAALAAETDAGKFLAIIKDTWADTSQRKLVTLARNDDVNLQFRTALSATLRDLLAHAFAPTGKHPVHRVAVFDSRGRIKQVVSQSDVVHLLAEHAAALGPLGAQTLEQLGFAHAVVSAPASAATASAFHTMHARNVTGLAVLNESGHLVKNLSASDLRGVTGEHGVARLLEPVGEFAPDRPLITLRPTATLADAVHALARNRVHHVFLVDEHNCPRGIVTLSDVLRSVLAAAVAEEAHGEPAAPAADA